MGSQTPQTGLGKALVVAVPIAGPLLAGVILGKQIGDGRWIVSGVVVAVVLPLFLIGLLASVCRDDEGGPRRLGTRCAWLLAVVLATGLPVGFLGWLWTSERAWLSGVLIGPFCAWWLLAHVAGMRLSDLAVDLGPGLLGIAGMFAFSWTFPLTGQPWWFAGTFAIPVVFAGYYAYDRLRDARDRARERRKARRTMALTDWLVLRVLLFSPGTAVPGSWLVPMTSARPGELVPGLARLEAAGLLTSTWSQEDGNGSRHREYALPSAVAERAMEEADDEEPLWDKAKRRERRQCARVHDLVVADKFELALEHAVEVANEMAKERRQAHREPWSLRMPDHVQKAAWINQTVNRALRATQDEFPDPDRETRQRRGVTGFDRRQDARAVRLFLNPPKEPFVDSAGVAGQVAKALVSAVVVAFDLQRALDTELGPNLFAARDIAISRVLDRTSNCYSIGVDAAPGDLGLLIEALRQACLSYVRPRHPLPKAGRARAGLAVRTLIAFATRRLPTEDKARYREECLGEAHALSRRARLGYAWRVLARRSQLHRAIQCAATERS